MENIPLGKSFDNHISIVGNKILKEEPFYNKPNGFGYLPFSYKVFISLNIFF